MELSTIDKKVPKGIVGNFLLGESTSENNNFSVLSLGRSDTDLNQELKKYVGNYNHFQFSYAFSKYDAFFLECTHYHVFKELAKDIHDKEHPKAPEGCNWFCPVCGK
ncbi:MAG TPA: hypothetical protein VIK14_01825 [Ignavibacteria bacterium]